MVLVRYLPGSVIGTQIAQGANINKSNIVFVDSHPSATQPQYSTIDVELTAGAELSGSTHTVGIYSAVEQVANGPQKIYGMNPVVQIDAGLNGLAIGCEIDVNNNGINSLNVDAVVINGNSTQSPQHAIVIQAVGATWNEGVEIGNYNTYGLFILRPTGTAKAILVWNASNTFSFSVAPRGTIGTSQSGANIAVTQATTTKVITWAIAEPDALYEVYVSGNFAGNFFVTGKSTTQCTVNFTSAPASATIDVVLMRADSS